MEALSITVPARKLVGPRLTDIEACEQSPRFAAAVETATGRLRPDVTINSTNLARYGKLPPVAHDIWNYWHDHETYSVDQAGFGHAILHRPAYSDGINKKNRRFQRVAPLSDAEITTHDAGEKLGECYGPPMTYRSVVSVEPEFANACRKRLDYHGNKTDCLDVTNHRLWREWTDHSADSGFTLSDAEDGRSGTRYQRRLSVGTPAGDRKIQKLFDELQSTSNEIKSWVEEEAQAKLIGIDHTVASLSSKVDDATALTRNDLDAVKRDVSSIKNELSEIKAMLREIIVAQQSTPSATHQTESFFSALFRRFIGTPPLHSSAADVTTERRAHLQP